MRKLYTLLFALAIGVGMLWASDTAVDGIWYDFNDSTLTASVTYQGDSYDTYANEYSGAIVIPSEVIYEGKTYRVTTIGNVAFYYCFNVTSVTLPESVTRIGMGAFWGCVGMTSIEIPNSVTELGNSTFYYCSRLSSIDLPRGLKVIPDGTFGSCVSLTSIHIPDSVTSIENTAFIGCSSLQEITIPESVTSIGESAFHECYGLTSMFIPGGVTYIGEGAFGYTTALTEITVAEDNKAYCSEDGVLFTKSKSLLLAYPAGKQNESYVIPKGTKRLGENAFSLCATLTAVTIPDGLTVIGSGAFIGCTGLTSVELPNSVTRIEEGAFFNCHSLASINIPNGITSIESMTFYHCDSLTTMVIPAGVASIGDNAFDQCPNFNTFYNYAETPQPINETVFTLNVTPCTLYVPAGSVDLYKADENWSKFAEILPIAAEEKEVRTVEVGTSETAASIAWPKLSGAYTYELVIKDQNGNIVCTLLFNANGQLLGITFNVPANGKTSQRAQTAGFEFTVTGLDRGTSYDLTITAKDENNEVIDKQELSFRTDGTQAIDDVDANTKAVKFLRDGQILIQKGGKTFDLRGQEVNTPDF